MNSATSRILSVLLLICITTSLLSVIIHLNDEEYKTETATYAEADDSVSFKAIYIRNEEVVRYSGNGVVSYEVPDGGKLGKGSVIAEIYADESQIDVKQKQIIPLVLIGLQGFHIAINCCNGMLVLFKSNRNPFAQNFIIFQ